MWPWSSATWPRTIARYCFWTSRFSQRPRNATATGFFSFIWDGKTFSGTGKNANQLYTAPNGSYVVTVSVLKALGNEANPADWETWTSPAFTIARP